MSEEPMKPRAVSKRSATAGFSLVELLTTLLIVGILAAIAVPTYNAQTRKSRRTEARTALLDLAGREERLFSTTNTYSNKPVDLGYGVADATFPMNVGSGYYSVAVEVDNAATPATFKLTALPVAGKGQDKDTQCVTFSVTQTGKQRADNSSGSETTDTCWG